LLRNDLDLLGATIALDRLQSCDICGICDLLAIAVDAEGRPLMRKPIIQSHGSSPDHIAAIGKIGKILSREPLSANLKKVSEE
jgi:hypothetical protein